MRRGRKFCGREPGRWQQWLVVPLNLAGTPEVKFSALPGGLRTASSTMRRRGAGLNDCFPEGVDIDLSSVDLTTIRDQPRASVAALLSRCGFKMKPLRQFGQPAG